MSGISEDTYGEFADQAMQAQAANVREATTDQQKLQLEQFLSALGISGDLTKAASALMGQYAGAGADLQRSASANIASGGDLMKAAEGIALGRLQTGVSGANDVMRTELARLGLGGDLINQANQTALSRANFGASTMGNIESLAASNKQNALQALLGVGGLQMGAGDAMTRLTAADNANMIQAMQTFSQLLNGAGGLFQGQQQLQQAEKFGQIDAFLKSMGLSGDFMNNYANWYQNSAAGLNNTAGLFAGAFPSLFGGYSNLSNSLIEAAMQPGFWERLAGQAVSGAAAGATGALGTWLGGGKKSSR
jgi:hypothetical protein